MKSVYKKAQTLELIRNFKTPLIYKIFSILIPRAPFSSKESKFVL